MAPHKRSQQPIKAREMPNSGSGVLCVSEQVAAELRRHFDVTQTVYPIWKSAEARVAGGRD